jgi:hypothetical protein
MTIKLFAHMLWGSAVADGPGAASIVRPLDFGRWVLEELAVRRWEPVVWRLQRPPRPQPRDSASSGPETSALDSNWADTQPWCHE